MSAKMKMRTGMVMAALLLSAYFVSQVAKDRADERPATVTVTWKPNGAGVVIVVRIGGKFYVGGATFVTSPFHETYDVRPGDSILVVVDPVVAGPEIHCSIVVPRMPAVTNEGKGHTTCLTTVT